LNHVERDYNHYLYQRLNKRGFLSLEILKRVKQLENCTKESLRLKKKWDSLRPDERTQRKATISNRINANAKEMMMVQDALVFLRKSGLARI